LVASAVVVCAAVVALAGAVPGPVSDAQYRYSGRLEESPGYREFVAISDIIGDSRLGVIARDSSLQALLPDNQVYTHFLLTEDEYVTFLLWPDDEAVVETLQARDIGWVLLRNETAWERHYHVWLQHAYGAPARHYQVIPDARDFTERHRGDIYTLYQLTPRR
jgi:hypothetical protein